MSLRTEVDQRASDVAAEERQEREASEADLLARKEQVLKNIQELHDLLQPLGQEAKKEGVRLYTSLDPEISNWFKRRYGGLPLSYAEEYVQGTPSGQEFQPTLSKFDGRHGDTRGLFVVVEKIITGERDTTSQEKLRANLNFAKEKYIFGNSAAEPAPEKVLDVLRGYYQSLTFFPGTKVGKDAWAMTRNSHFVKSQDLLSQPVSGDIIPTIESNLYYLLDSNFSPPKIAEVHNSPEACVDFVRRNLVDFLVEVDESEAYRESHPSSGPVLLPDLGQRPLEQ